MVRKRNGGTVITRPYINNPLVTIDRKLFYADYFMPVLLEGDRSSKSYACWCMISDDNARTWERHGLIAYGESGQTMMGEPNLVQTSDGDLACVIRCTDHNQKPMLITHSIDMGATWETPERLFDYGVMSQTLRLGCGVIALSFGRLGVSIMFSPDGRAREWTAPVAIVVPDAHDIQGNTGGYTGMVALGDSRFLLAYSVFHYGSQADGTTKAIMVRTVEVS